MLRSYVCLLAMFVFVGCSGRVFANLGNGVAVPSEAIDALAREKGITHAQARNLLREESEQQWIAEHAETYGVSFDEAKEQLEHARVLAAERNERSANTSRLTTLAGQGSAWREPCLWWVVA